MAAAAKNRADRVLSFRMRIGLTMILVMLMVLGGRLFHVQGLDPAGHAQAAVSERLRSVPLPAHRGDILDAQDRVLATSVDRYDLVVDQQVVDDFVRRDDSTQLREEVPVETGIAELSEVLDMDIETLTERVIGEDRYSVVARSLTPQESEQATEIGIPGLYAEPVSERSYPSGSVAGSIIGFMGSDGPLEGVEAAQDEALSGTDGERIFEVGGDGIRIPVATFEELPAEDGQDIRLTIDQDLQWFAQEAIAKKSNQYNAA